MNNYLRGINKTKASIQLINPGCYLISNHHSLSLENRMYVFTPTCLVKQVESCVQRNTALLISLAVTFFGRVLTSLRDDILFIMI